MADLIQTPILISAELNSKDEKCSLWSNCLKKYVIIIHVLGLVRACSRHSDSGVRRERSKGEKNKEEKRESLALTPTPPEIFMHLIQCIILGSAEEN